jgi:hypothetical protein
MFTHLIRKATNPALLQEHLQGHMRCVDMLEKNVPGVELALGCEDDCDESEYVPPDMEELGMFIAWGSLAQMESRAEEVAVPVRLNPHHLPSIVPSNVP